MATGKGRRFSEDEDGGTFHGEGDGEYCEVCKQEFLGHCPIRSSKCPFEGGGGEDEEEDGPGYRGGEDEER
jgi:hypothetical protein